MLKLCRVTKVRVLFLALVFVFNFDLFKFSAAILEKGLFSNSSSGATPLVHTSAGSSPVGTCCYYSGSVTISIALTPLATRGSESSAQAPNPPQYTLAAGIKCYRSHG